LLSLGKIPRARVRKLPLKNPPISQRSGGNCVTFHYCFIVRGESSGGDRPLLKPANATLLIIILYNSENSIHDIRPFCRPIFCHRSVVNKLHLSYSSEPIIRLDYQMLLQSPPYLYWLDPPLFIVDPPKIDSLKLTVQMCVKLITLTLYASQYIKSSMKIHQGC